MGSPGANTVRVKRDTLIHATPEEVRGTLMDGRLADWLGDEADFDAGESGALRLHSEGETRIELTLEPVPAGTRVVVVEATSIGGPSESALSLAWHRRLADLRRTCLDGKPAVRAAA